MKEPLRIFVAGPYCPYGETPHNAIRVAQINVDAAITVANEIHDRGHYAFVPHLTHYLHAHPSCSHDRYDWYYHYDNSFLDLWANALFFLRESPGANKELERAIKRGLTIYRQIDDVPYL
ncbi:MAG: hypothetical protein WC455_26815 [Dehalococcoidia bacterium]|jgi:hypothetical protein